MTGLLDLLADGSHADANLRFGLDQPVVTGAEVWSQAEQCARWFAAIAPEGGAVGAFLTLTPDTVPTMVGAWLAGVTLVSLPLPGRRPDLPSYLGTLKTIFRQLNISLVVSAEGTRFPLVGTYPVRMEPFAAASRGGPPFPHREPGGLVQFTSGSTGAPKGVRISLDALAVNVEAIIRRFALDNGVRCCSWLPLSHDMGLIGALFTSWAACGRERAGGGAVMLSTPQSFLRDPLRWLKDCSDNRADYTLVPNVALDLVTRRLREHSGSLDLMAMRRVVVGSEPISAVTLERFIAAGEAVGLSSRALCPAYGMAEVGVGISAVTPEEDWSTVCISPDAVAVNRWSPAEHGAGKRFVSLGRPLDGVDVRVALEGNMDEDAGARIGYLEVRSGSMLTEYVTAQGSQPVRGWLRTPDLGYVARSGEVFVTGRSQEIIVVAGRNLYATDIERAAEEIEFVRPGHCAAVSDGNGRYAVIAELAPRCKIDTDRIRLFRTSLLREVGLGPSEIVFVSPGALSKTPSGKMRRYEIARSYEEDGYKVLARQRFRLGA